MVQVPALALPPLPQRAPVVVVEGASVAADFPLKAGRALRPRLGLVGQERKRLVAVVEPQPVLAPGGGHPGAVAAVAVESAQPAGESSRK